MKPRYAAGAGCETGPCSTTRRSVVNESLPESRAVHATRRKQTETNIDLCRREGTDVAGRKTQTLVIDRQR